MSDARAEHSCRRFTGKLVWSDWELRGSVRERTARRAQICSECGRERPSRAPRRAVFVEATAERRVALPTISDEARTVAAELMRHWAREKGGVVRARGLKSAAHQRGMPPTLVDEWLETFLRAGCVSLSWRVQGTRRELFSVSVADAEVIEELAAPGARQEWNRAFEDAVRSFGVPTHPIAVEIARLVSEENVAQGDVRLLRALVTLARHIEDGDTLAARVFSARYLGDSKALAGVRRRLEKIVGPLEHLGIREGAATTLVGGRGDLLVAGHAIELSGFTPFLGLARETILRLERVDFPRDGILVVENLAPFEACCRGELPGVGEALVVWSGGYPGRAVRTIVEAAARQDVRVRCWADLDLDGVRIARLVASWSTPTFEPWHMTPEEVETATVRIPLSPRARRLIESDLERQPHALLADTLKAILAAGQWVEQEALLGPTA